MPKIKEPTARERGIAAIIYLQGLADITESPERAGKQWDAFDQWDRTNTLAAHARFSRLLSPPIPEETP